MLILFAVVSLVPMMSGACTDRLIMPPEVTAAVGADVERRLIPWRGGQLEMFETRSAGARAGNATLAAMVMQLSGGNAADVARMLAHRWGERAVGVWAINYPGYGQSSGRRTLADLGDAAMDAFDALRRTAPDRPIIVEGFSLGTVPALRVAAERKVDGLILQNPPPLVELIRGHFAWWNLGLIAWPVSMGVPEVMKSIENARQASAPAIFLMAEMDRSVPVRFQRRIVEAYAGEKRVIRQRGADHVAPLSDSEQRALDEGMDWLLSHGEKNKD
jgi:uncharacterized protein